MSHTVEASAIEDGHVHDRLPAVDACRGIALALVLAYHVDFIPAWGTIGMDLFFVVSGFVITRRLLATRGIAWFWWRRFRRLVPALVALVIGVACIGATGAWGTAPVGRDAAAALAYVSNWVQIRAGSTYWAATETASPLKHLWSLAVEEQFYVVWPLVIAALALVLRDRSRLRNGVRLLAPILMVAAFVWTRQLSGYSDITRVYEGTDARAGALLAGSALAAWWAPRTARAIRDGALGLAAGAACVVVGVLVSMHPPDALAYWSGPTAASVALASTLLVAAGATPSAALAWRRPIVRPVAWLGSRSYGAYLWHWPLVLLARSHDIAPAWAILPTLLLAEASYRALEPPRWLVHIPRPAATRWLAAGVAAAFLAAALTATRVTEPQDSAAKEARPRKIVTSSSAVSGTAPGPGTVSKPKFEQILIIGDSIADSLIDDFAAVLPAGTSLIDDAYAGCDGAEHAPGLNRTSGPGCDQWRDRWAALFPDKHPSTMALWFSGNIVPTARADGDNVPGHVGEQKFDTWWSGTVKDRIQVLRSYGIEVVLVLPHWPDDTRFTRWYFGENDFPKLVQRVTRVRELLSSIAQEMQVPLIDLAAIVCPEGLGHCRTDGEDGQELRPDGSHYSEYLNGEPSDTKPRAAWVAREVLRNADQELGVSQTGR